MISLNIRQKAILAHYTQIDAFTPQQAKEALGLTASLVTVRRDIRALVDFSYLKEDGAGPALRYFKTILGTLLTPIDATEYQNIDVDKRGQKITFNQALFPQFPKNIFSSEEMEKLNGATTRYKKKIENQTQNIHAKELERFVIELSWKSSRIEGNTYTLLDTELLLKEGTPALGKTPEETTMILNHKTAFTFIMEQRQFLRQGNLIHFLEELHRLLTDNLSIDQGIRKSLVGITGTNYVPLEIGFQIQEALNDLCESIERASSAYQKALLALVGVSYIQPFVDGNKRTARLFANAFLISENLAPLSYRNVDERDYREAILVFYERNSILPMKNIFIEQYLFSTENYTL